MGASTNQLQGPEHNRNKVRPSMIIDRTPEEFTAYVRRLEELAWRLVGDSEEYHLLMEDPSLANQTYVEALELLILFKSGGAD